MKDKKLLALVEKATREDQAAFEKLCELKGREIIFLCTREMGNIHDGQDAAQEVFIRMQKNIGSLKAPEAFNVWLNRIVVTTCSNLRRNMMKHKNLLALENYQDVFIDDTPVGLPQEFAEDEDGRRRVVELIDELPEKYRTCVLLHYYQRMSYDEVAEVMDVTRNTVDHNLKMARKILKIQLEDEFGPEEGAVEKKAAMFSLGAVVSAAMIETAKDTISVGMIASCMTAAGVHTAFAGTAAAAGGGFLSNLAGSIGVKVAAAAVAVAVVGGGAWYAVDQSANVGDTPPIVASQPDVPDDNIAPPAVPLGNSVVKGDVVLENSALDAGALNGLDGLTLEIVEAENPDRVLQTAVSVGGEFEFSKLAFGQYIVRARLPGNAQIVGSSGSSDGIEWDGAGRTVVFEVKEDGPYTCPTLTLNLNTEVRGRLRMTDGSEPPTGALEGIKMELVDPQGCLIAETVTDAAGEYCFEDPMVSQKGVYTLRLLEKEDMKVSFTETFREIYLEPRLG